MVMDEEETKDSEKKEVIFSCKSLHISLCDAIIASASCSNSHIYPQNGLPQKHN